jgi:hypothetical protein
MSAAPCEFPTWGIRPALTRRPDTWSEALTLYPSLGVIGLDVTASSAVPRLLIG